MADQKKHTIEDVLAQYAQTEEGAAHLAEQAVSTQQKSPAAKVAKGTKVQEDVEVIDDTQRPTVQQAFAQQAAEALNRPSIKEAHELRQEEIKQELRDNKLGFLEVPMESLPTGGIFYPEGTRIWVRAASGGDIRHWSMTDETDLNAIDDAITYIIERCMKITFPSGTATWKDLKEIDRLYITLSIRDFTFTEGNNELKIKISEDRDIAVHKDDISFIDLSDKILKYYNQELRCFTFPVKNPQVKTINIFMPCVGVTQWLKDYIRRKQQRQEAFDQDFVTIAPMLINDYRKLNDNSYAGLLRDTMNWGPYEWSLVSKVKSVIQNAITPKLTYIDESGAEAETPLNFQGGIKAIFNLNLDEDFDF